MSRDTLDRYLGFALAVRIAHGGVSWAEVARRRTARREAAVARIAGAPCAGCGHPVAASDGRDGAGRGPCCDIVPGGAR